jgi:hypothetical protein
MGFQLPVRLRSETTSVLRLTTSFSLRFPETGRSLKLMVASGINPSQRHCSNLVAISLVRSGLGMSLCSRLSAAERVRLAAAEFRIRERTVRSTAAVAEFGRWMSARP